MRVTPIRLVAVDLDGTLLDPDLHPRPGALAALKSLRDDGIAWCVATGRAIGSADRLRDILKPTAGWICTHGSVGDFGTWTHRTPLLPHEVAALTGLLDTDHPDTAIGVDSADVLYHDPHYPVPEWTGDRALIEATRPLMAAIEPDMIRLHSPDMGKIAVAIEEHDLPMNLWPCTDPAYAEITRTSATKKHTVASLAAHLGLDAAQIAAIGDGYNDITLLQWAGLGIAPEHAHLGALGAADHVMDASPTWFTSAVDRIRAHGRPQALY